MTLDLEGHALSSYWYLTSKSRIHKSDTWYVVCLIYVKAECIVELCGFLCFFSFVLSSFFLLFCWSMCYCSHVFPHKHFFHNIVLIIIVFGKTTLLLSIHGHGCITYWKWVGEIPWKKTLVADGLMLESTHFPHVISPLEKACNLSMSLSTWLPSCT